MSLDKSTSEKSAFEVFQKLGCTILPLSQKSHIFILLKIQLLTYFLNFICKFLDLIFEFNNKTSPPNYSEM